MPDYKIQAFDLESFSLMKELFKSAFQIDLSAADFKKKFYTKNVGHKVIGFIAMDIATNTPAAFYGVFPVMLLINGKEVLAAQSGDTMTHKKHRKKGLFVKLAKITFEECHRQGIQLIFGQPNKNSFHGFINKLDWIHLDDSVRYDLKLTTKTFPLPKVLKKINLFNFYLKYANRFLQRRLVKGLTHFTSPAQTALGKVLRNKEYLLYKEDKNKMFIKIHDVILWVKFTDVFWIGDFSSYDKITPATILKIKKLAFLLGYNTITFHINKSLPAPWFLNNFKKFETAPSCFYYVNIEYINYNLVLTGADFDTW